MQPPQMPVAAEVQVQPVLWLNLVLEVQEELV